MRTHIVGSSLLLLILSTLVIAADHDIFTAIQNHSASVVAKYVKENPAVLREIDRNGFTPLYMATAVNDFEIIKLLVEAGADVNAATNQGNTPLMVACSRSKLEVVLYLLDHKARMRTNDHGMSPLWAAVRRTGYTLGDNRRSVRDSETGAIVELLIAKGGDPNEFSVDSLGRTNYLIGSAAVGGTPEALAVLLKHGVDIDVQDPQGLTPLHALIALPDRQHRENPATLQKLKMLLTAGANLKIPDKDGWTPMHSAVWFNQPRVVSLLLQRGADPNAKTPAGETPLVFARKQKFKDIEQLLIKATEPKK